MLSSAMSLQYLKNGRFEVVIDDHARHPSPELKGMALTEEKGFLPLSGEAFHKHRSRKTEPSSQEGDFDQLACQLDDRFAKVKLCPLAWSKVERDKGRFRALTLLLHKHAHGRFPNRDAELAQFHPHAMRSPALFGGPAREPLILFEPLLNVWQSGITHWRLTWSL